MFSDNLLVKPLFLLMLFSSISYASDRLYIQDPQSPRRNGQGTIEEAILSVKPKGLYMECGLYLTISGKGLGFGAQDTTEILYYFELPEEAIIYDHWLWIGDKIIRGELLDKWTASSIYEDIVNRRKDPSILFKRSQTEYELRIYPMAGNESRKIKITFLLPTNWSSKSVSSTLPVNMLNVSKYPISTFYILSWIGEEWKNPRIVEFPDNKFQPFYDEKFGDYLRADIPIEATQASLNYSIDAPYENGVYINKFEGPDENYYQLAFLLSEITNLDNSSKKVAFLFDDLSTKSDYGTDEILSSVKEILHSSFVAQDSFNLIFTNLDIQRVNESWLPADSLTIETIFSNLKEDVISDYSSLPALLSNGIEFVQENGNNGSLFLLSSSDQVGDYTIANALIDDIMSKMNPIFPIHVADYANTYAQFYRIGGRYYRGNEYFFTNITRLTSANYLTTRSGKSLSDIVLELSQSLGGFITSFDLHTTLENGFNYGRLNFNSFQTVYLNRPILQVGKYNGTFPFKIEIAGEFNNSPFSNEINISNENAFSADSLNEEIWSGIYIHSLEKEAQTNDIISEIINQSLDKRVLSLYTAFLCLEPSRGGKVCYGCIDESRLISGLFETSNTKNDSLVSVYPNPFNIQTNIQVNLAKFKDLKNLSFKIYNITGQVVKTFPGEVNSTGNLHFVWNGRDNNGAELSSGTYFFMVSNGRSKIVRKLLLMK